jgi:hypothetical protein
MRHTVDQSEQPKSLTGSCPAEHGNLITSEEGHMCPPVLGRERRSVRAGRIDRPIDITVAQNKYM